MSPSALEAFLVLIHANSAARARFKADPYDEAKRTGLSDNECAALLTAARRPPLPGFIFHDLISIGITGTAKCYTALVGMCNVRILRLPSAGVFENTPGLTVDT